MTGPKKRSQRQVVEELLLRTRRISTWNLIYHHGITRGADIIHHLRKEGWQIRTEQKEGQLAVYILEKAPELKLGL